MIKQRRDERGYAMMATLWFMLLAAALSAALLAHAMKGVRQVGRERSEWREQLALDNAVEIALAERLIDGSMPQSQLPPGQVEQVRVAIRPEATLINIETARLDDVVTALASAGVPPETSEALAAGLTGPNSSGATLGDIARRIEAISDDPQALCALLVLSPSGGATLRPEGGPTFDPGAVMAASTSNGPLRVTAITGNNVTIETITLQGWARESFVVVDRMIIGRRMICRIDHLLANA